MRGGLILEQEVIRNLLSVLGEISRAFCEEDQAEHHNEQSDDLARPDTRAVRQREWLAFIVIREQRGRSAQREKDRERRHKKNSDDPYPDGVAGHP